MQQGYLDLSGSMLKLGAVAEGIDSSSIRMPCSCRRAESKLMHQRPRSKMRGPVLAWQITDGAALSTPPLSVPRNS